MDFYLSPNEDVEVNINKVIREVVKLEKEFGLSDEEIKCKYSCGLCGDLAELVRVSLFVYAKQKVFVDVSGIIDEHCSVYIRDLNSKEVFPPKIYFDILGRHEYKDVDKWKKEFDTIQKIASQYNAGDADVRAEWRKNFRTIQLDILNRLEEKRIHIPE